MPEITTEVESARLLVRVLARAHDMAEAAERLALDRLEEIERRLEAVENG